MRTPIAALMAVVLLASCAAPPKPPLENVNKLWLETLEEWSDYRLERIRAMPEEDRAEPVERHTDLMYGLYLVNMVSILDTVGDSPWHGYVRIDGDLRAGQSVTVRLSTCPPGRKFILYGAPDLSLPIPRHGEESNDYWVIALEKQAVEGEGRIDAAGEASVTVHIPPDHAGGFRAFQARILGDDPGLKGQAFTKAHGRRIR